MMRLITQTSAFNRPTSCQTVGIRSWFILMLAVFALCTPVHAKFDNSRVLTPKAMREDTRATHKLLKDLHPNYGFYEPAEGLSARFEAFEKTLTKPMNIRKFAAGLRTLVAMVKDGHTCLHFPRANTVQLDIHPATLHFPVRILSGRIFLLPGRSHKLAGAEILTLDDKPAPLLLQDLFTLVCTDGNSAGLQSQAVERAFGFYHWLAFGHGKTHPIKLKLRSGQDVSGFVRDRRLVLKNGTTLRLRKFRRKRRLPVSLQWLGKDIPVLKIRTFSTPPRQFRKLIVRHAQTIRRRRVKDFVLDLRQNSGGYVSNAAFVMSLFLDYPFQFPKFYHMSTHKLENNGLISMRRGRRGDLKRQIRRHNAFRLSAINRRTAAKEFPSGVRVPAQHRVRGRAIFDGNTHIIIDGATFSAGTLLASSLRRHTNGTLYGSQAGGSRNRSCLLSRFVHTLPNSKLKLRIADTCYIQFLSRQPANLNPDIAIKPGIGDILTGTDVVLQKVIKAVKAQRSTSE